MKLPLKTTLLSAFIAVSYTAVTIASSREKYYISAYKTDQKSRKSRIWVYQEGKPVSSAVFTAKTGAKELFYYPENGPLSFYFCNSVDMDTECPTKVPSAGSVHASLENQSVQNIPYGSKIKISSPNSNPLTSNPLASATRWQMIPEASKVSTTSVNVVKTDSPQEEWKIKASKENNVFAANKTLYGKVVSIKEKTGMTNKLKVGTNRDTYIIVEKPKGNDVVTAFRPGQLKRGDTLYIDANGKASTKKS